MAESLVGTSALFHKAVNPAVVVEPVEAPLHLPTLTGIAGVSAFGRNKGSTIVPAPRNTGMDISGKKGLTECVAVISFVRSEAYGCSDGNTINRAQCKVLIIAIGSPADNRQKIAPSVNDNTPFYPIDTMFSRVSAVFLTPFFDFTTEASRYPLRQCR